MLHSLLSWLANVAKPAAQKEANLLTHSSFWSIRTILVVAALAYLLYLNHLLLTPDNLALAGKIILVFLVCNTVTKLATIAANGWITVTNTVVSGKAGKLDDTEADTTPDRNIGQPGAVVSDPTVPARTP